MLPPDSLPQNCSLKEVGTKGTLVIEAPGCQEGLGWRWVLLAMSLGNTLKPLAREEATQ